MLVIISGPSGVGKNTVIEEILKRNPDYNYLMSCTTREPRDIESEKNNYIHLSNDDFKNKIKNNELFEFEEVHDNLYGTLNESIDKVCNGNHVYLKDMGVLGQEYYLNKFPNKEQMLSIFLDVEDDELFNRLTSRGEINIKKRMSRAEFERNYKKNFDIVISNYNINSTIQRICEAIDNRTH